MSAVRFRPWAPLLPSPSPPSASSISIVARLRAQSHYSFDTGRALEPLSNRLVNQLTAIYELKGKEALYRVQAPEILAALQTSAIIESTESSNRIEGVIASPERVREIVGKGSAPRTRSEAEIAGYRDVLGQIHAAHAYIGVTPNVILQLHRDMFRYTNAPAGMWKPADDTIEAVADGRREIVFVPVSAFATPGAMDQLCRDFAQTSAAGLLDPVLATAAFVLDFLCIHPFLDGNGRLARLLATLLLYKAGFNVARYVGVEKLVENTQASYYESLRASSEGWHEGRHSLVPWWEYFLGITLAAYQQLDRQLGGGILPPKADRVRLAIQVMPPVFSKAELAGMCPDVSVRTLKRVLDDMKAEGKIAIATRGRKAMWRKI